MNKEEFKKNANESIDELFKRYNELKAKTDSLSADLDQESKVFLNEMSDKKQELEQKYTHLKTVGEQNWEEAKKDFTVAYDSMKQGLDKLLSTF